METVNNYFIQRINSAHNGLNFSLYNDDHLLGELIVKIAVLFGYAISKNFIDEDGEYTLTFNKASLANYIYRRWKVEKYKDPVIRQEKLCSKYDKSHDKNSNSYYAYKYFKEEISKELEKADFWNNTPCKMNEFVQKLHAYQPETLKSDFTGFFSKIKREGKTIGYSLGTSHEGDEQVAKLNPKIKEAILKSKTIGLEVNPGFFTILKLLWFFVKNYSEAKSLINDKHEMAMKRAGLTSKQGIESTLKSLKKRGNSQIISFEHATVNLEDLKKLKENEKSEEEHYQSIIDMMKVFKEGNETSLLEIVNKYKQKWGEDFYNRKITERNRDMAKKSEHYLQTASTTNRFMIAIGAAHLLGDDGVNRSLQNDKTTLL